MFGTQQLGAPLHLASGLEAGVVVRTPAGTRVHVGVHRTWGELPSRKTCPLTVWWIPCMQVALVTNPIWVVKTRMALQKAPRASSVAAEASSRAAPAATYINMIGTCAVPTAYAPAHLCVKGGGVKRLSVPRAEGWRRWRLSLFADALVRIGREEGLKGLYKGVGPSLLLVSHGALQFMTYEELKKRMAAWRAHAQSLAAAAAAAAEEHAAHDTGRSSPSPTTHETAPEPSTSAPTRRGVELVRFYHSTQGRVVIRFTALLITLVPPRESALFARFTDPTKSAFAVPPLSWVLGSQCELSV